MSAGDRIPGRVAARAVIAAAAARARAGLGAAPTSPGAAAFGPPWAPGVIRALAVLQVFLQGCADKLSTRTGPEEHVPSDRSKIEPEAGAEADAPVVASAPEPTIVDASAFPAALLADLAGAYQRTAPRGPWHWVITGLAGAGAGPIDAAALGLWVPMIGEGDGRGDRLRAGLLEHLGRRGRGEVDTIAELDALLAAAEAWPLYDDFFAGYVWLRAMEAPSPPAADALAALLARIERHLRVTHALLRASAETGRVEFAAWRSKAAPPRGWADVRVPPGLGEAAARLYPTTDADTWASEATLPLVVTGAAPLVLRRAGQRVTIAPGGALTLRRLDLLEVGNSPAIVDHPTLGAIRLPAGAVVSAWTLGAFLSDDAKATVRGLVDAVIGGDEAANERLQALLPAAHSVIRGALEGPGQSPEARGRLEMVLVIFDE